MDISIWIFFKMTETKVLFDESVASLRKKRARYDKNEHNVDGMMDIYQTRVERIILSLKGKKDSHIRVTYGDLLYHRSEYVDKVVKPFFSNVMLESVQFVLPNQENQFCFMWLGSEQRTFGERFTLKQSDRIRIPCLPDFFQYSYLTHDINDGIFDIQLTNDVFDDKCYLEICFKGTYCVLQSFPTSHLILNKKINVENNRRLCFLDDVLRDGKELFYVSLFGKKSEYKYKFGSII